MNSKNVRVFVQKAPNNKVKVTVAILPEVEEPSRIERLLKAAAAAQLAVSE